MFSKYVKTACYLFLATALVVIGFGITRIALPENLQEQIVSTDLSPNPYLFFTVYDQTQDTVQVWRRELNGSIQHSFMELPTQYPASGLPIQELALLKDRYCSTQQNNCSIENLSLNFNLGWLSLSPDEEWLAWSEGAAWCPGTRCYGTGRFVIWNLVRGERQELLEIPAHMERFATQGIGKMTWSPNSKEVGFVHSSQDNGWSRIRIIDIETKQIRDLGDGQGPIAWSPTGEQLAFFAENKVKIVSKDGVLQATFDGGWMETDGLDWSPDGTKLAITASTTPILQDLRFGLFIADIGTGGITPVNIDRDELRSYTDPQWSPDGLLIGVNTSPNEHELVNRLIIFDPEDEIVKGNLILERRQPNWLWSRTGEAILVNLPSVERIGIFYWQEDRLEEISPPTSLEEGIRKGEISISDLAW